ncbi:MAG TPA: cytochrome c [Candidatus Acidoferrales bacterium]|nr:cytochrome c [Candidatus Acidoferrales bacterium]
MRQPFAIVAALLLAGVAAFSAQQEKPKDSQASPAEFKVPPEEAKRTNPTKATPQSLAEARRLYGFECAMCHGKDGDGKGDLVEQMKLQMQDLRDPATTEKLTDGEIFYIVTKGKGQMPPEDRLSDSQKWQLVNLVRSFAKKEGAPKPKEEPKADSKPQ